LILILTFATEAERDKFEHIFNKYKNLMLHKAYGILRDYSLAEDAASEAFIRIYKNLGKIGNPDDNRSAAFVVTIVKNVSLTMLQREKGRITEEYDEEAESGFDLEEEALSRLEGGHIRETLDKLGEELKAVFLLKYAYDLPHREIGSLLGISENNVTVRLHRAKKRLAAILREEGFADA
jgi:RNA polymerase sigma-70 factor (ECF subfamily)